jgi:outer membrane lipase/esterase
MKPAMLFVDIVITLLLMAAMVQAKVIKNTPAVVFAGCDSLSDSGNISHFTQGRLPYAVPPSSPYFAGPPYYHGDAVRFSNGPVWTERFVAIAGYPTDDAAPALLGLAQGNNFCIGGARTRGHAEPQYDHLFSCLKQVEAYLARGIMADAAHVVWCGANDVEDGITTVVLASVTQQDPVAAEAAATAAMRTAADDVAAMVQHIAAQGGHRFIVPNVPNLSRAPGVLALDALLPGMKGVATRLSQAFNAQLTRALDALEAAQQPHIDLVRFDAEAFVDLVIDNGPAFGFLDVTTPCYTGDETTFVGPIGTVCSNPDQHMFWGEHHPGARFHELLGQAMACQASQPTEAHAQEQCATLGQ